MALPLTPNTTYAAGSQVQSADLNDLQAAVVDAAHGEVREYIPITSPPQGWTASTDGDKITPDSGGNKLHLQIPARAGATLTEVHARVRSVTDQITLALKSRPYAASDGGGTGGIATVDSVQSTDNHGFIEDVALTGLSEVLDLDDDLSNAPEKHWIEIVTEHATNEVWDVYVVYSQPLA
jgi:hypothetical protein